MTNLTYTQALILLGIPEEERDEFIAEHDVESMTATVIVIEHHPLLINQADYIIMCVFQLAYPPLSLMKINRVLGIVKYSYVLSPDCFTYRFNLTGITSLVLRSMKQFNL